MTDVLVSSASRSKLLPGTSPPTISSAAPLRMA